MKEDMNNERKAMDFWGRVERAQQLSGKTNLKDLCRTIGVPYQTLANQRTGARLPALPIAVALAKELGTSVEWLLSGSGDDKVIEESRIAAIVKKIETMSQNEVFALEVLLGLKS